MRAADVTPDPAAVTELLRVHIGDLRLGCDVRRVEGVARLRGFTEIPRTAELVRGVMNRGGTVLTIVDAHRMLGQGSAPLAAGDPIVIVRSALGLAGIPVDRTAGLVPVAAEDLGTVAATIDGPIARFMLRLHEAADGPWCVLDHDALLATALAPSPARAHADPHAHASVPATSSPAS